MKRFPLAFAVTAIIAITVFISCRKSVEEPASTQPEPDPSQAIQVDSSGGNPLVIKVVCLDGPNYGDSIIYSQPVNPGQDYIVNPLNPQTGSYVAFPKGLSINSATGAINVTKSETGLRYQVGFIKPGQKDTCFHPIVIAGSSYIDSVYSIDGQNPQANPYFNANPSITSVCGAGSGCHFDISHKGTGKGVKINPSTGVMQLKETKDIFGSHPFNGEFVDVNMDYSLNDKSNNAIQQMSLRFVYFERRADVPSWLSDLVKSRRDNTLDNTIITGTGTPKPTLIIITRYK